MNEGIALACFFRLEICADVEIANGSGKARSELACIEGIDLGNSADAVPDVVPGVQNGVTGRRDQSQPGDNDPSLGHGLLLAVIALGKQRRTRRTGHESPFFATL